MEEHLKINRATYFILLCFVCFLTVYNAPVRYTTADPWGTLLVSQSLIEYGTVKLDYYYKSKGGSLNDNLNIKNGHLYFYFPIGPSICSIPFVWLANFRGENMLFPESDHKLQILLASITVVLAFMLIFLICHSYLNYTLSFLFSSTFVFGSSIASTMGTALWSLNLTTVIILALLYLIIRNERQNRQFNPYLTGGLLFMAYLCRPTSSVFIFAFMLYLFLKNRQSFYRVAVVSGFLFFGFVLWSLLEYHQLLPDYYLPTRPDFSRADTTFFQRLYGTLLSPSRGMLVYQPYLWLVLFGTVTAARHLYRNHIFWMSIVCFLMHWYIISRYPGWWGGHCYGSRLMTDSLPFLILLSCLIWNKFLFSHKLIIFIPLAVISVFINTYQGLYNPLTTHWNPLIDSSKYLFDWRYPQFMANPKLISSLKNDVKLNQLTALNIGDIISSDGNNAVLDNWYDQEKSDDITWRWSGARTASIVFKTKLNLNQGEKLALKIEGASYKAQPVDVFLNGVRVGCISNESPSVMCFPIPEWSLVKTDNGINKIQFVQVKPVLVTEPGVGRNIFVRFSKICLYSIPFGN